MATSVFTFDYATFIVAFPAFSNSTTYPQATLQRNWNVATCFISPVNYGWLAGDCRLLACNLMTAHLALLANQIQAGMTPQLINSSQIDKIHISLTAPPLHTQAQWWYQTTPYGMELYALLQSKSVGGFYIGGSCERAGFRKAYGRF